ncbi:MAG: hypothetical protein ABEJ73_05630 [Haloplanus sp.]
MTRLAEDRRARVPFALVGVLLLVGASTFAATVATDGPSRINRDADVAMERVSTETTAAVRSAVGEAARAAAAEPVTMPAETRYGRLLSDAHPFRDALRLRIYLSVRDRLRVTRYRRGDVTAVASLPNATTPAGLRRGMERIQLSGVENGTALRVTVRNLTVTARDAGRVVARERHSRTVTVSTPVLALHDRATAFETRLNRGPLDGPGLGRQLTARLYPIAWARGYAQYTGLPIANVVANRHVETTTNGALLATQRSVFGQSDPAARRATRRAMVELGVREITASTRANAAWADRVLPRPNRRRDGTAAFPRRRGTSAPSPTRRIDVDVAPIPGRAQTGLRTETIRSNRSLEDVLRAAYRVETRLRTARRRTYAEPRPDPEAPGEGWSLADRSVTTDIEVGSSVGSAPAATPDERRFESFTRRVTVDHHVRWRWERDDDTTSTSGEWTERYRVGVTLVGEYAPNGTAPDRPTSPRFERGGPLDGPNLAGVAATAETRLVDQQGGRDAVARAVVTDNLDVTERVVYGDRPSELRSWTYADLTTLRNRLANVSVAVRAGRVATYATNPAGQLAAEIRGRRSSWIDAPERYRGAADRARVGARAALIDETLRRLERRAATYNATRRTFDSALRRVGLGSSRTLGRILDARHTPPPSRRAALPGAPPGGSVAVVPDGSPAYLTVASVSHDRAAGVPPSRPYHPLAAKNVNLFAAPYGDAADAVATPGFDHPSQVRLRTAARILIASESVTNASVREPRRELRSSVSSSVDAIRDRAWLVVRNETHLSRPEARAAVDEGIGRWDDPGRRALAATNGSLARSVAVAADARASGSAPNRADRLETGLDAAITETLRTPAATVAQAQVNATVTRVKERVVETAASKAVDRIDQKYLKNTLGMVPAGVPVAPAPGYWYATVNVWEVSVRGAYARFSLRTRRGTSAPATATRYVRDGSIVRLDVDGDGERERLGRDERITVSTRTVIAVAVPPYRDGVGDVNGNADERAGAWPRPGCTSWSAQDCPEE